MIIALKIIALVFAVFLASLGGWVVRKKDSSNFQYWAITFIAFFIGLVAALA